MNSFQPGIKFKTVDEFLDFIPESELLIVSTLRDLIFESLPEVRENLSYNVPFYFGQKRMFYIWPASIPWGGITKGVHLGFARGRALADPYGLLQAGTGKTMAGVTFHSIRDIPIEAVRAMIFEAAFLDNPKGTFGTFKE